LDLDFDAYSNSKLSLEAKITTSKKESKALSSFIKLQKETIDDHEIVFKKLLNHAVIGPLTEEYLKSDHINITEQDQYYQVEEPIKINNNLPKIELT
jgi:hypothetical protein